MMQRSAVFLEMSNPIVAEKSFSAATDSMLRHARNRLGWLTLALLLAECFALQGCVVPRSGPLASEVRSSSERNAIELVQMTPEIAAATREKNRATFPSAFQGSKLINAELLAPGDGVNVTFWGRDSVGLFPNVNGTTDTGELVINQSGSVNVPYMGEVTATGLTVSGLRDAIMHRLGRLTVGAEVGVRRTDRRGQTVTVQGDLTKPGVYPLGPDTLRLSGLLSQASPSQTNPEELDVTVRRRVDKSKDAQMESASVRLSDVYNDAAEDIPLQPGDLIVVHDSVRRLFVLGAVSEQGAVRLTKRNYSLLDAIGDAKGLSDALANPKAVYLMRTQAVDAASGGDARPVVYQFDFSRPEQIVLAGAFTVRDGDALYVSDAPFTQVQKVLSAFSATSGTARSASSL